MPSSSRAQTLGAPGLSLASPSESHAGETGSEIAHSHGLVSIFSHQKLAEEAGCMRHASVHWRDEDSFLHQMTPSPTASSPAVWLPTWHLALILRTEKCLESQLT